MVVGGDVIRSCGILWKPLAYSDPNGLVDSFSTAISQRHEHAFYRSFPKNGGTELIEDALLCRVFNNYVYYRYKLGDVDDGPISSLFSSMALANPIKFSPLTDGCLMKLPFVGSNAGDKKLFLSLVSLGEELGNYAFEENFASALRCWLIESDHFMADSLGEFDKQMEIFNQQTPLLSAQPSLD